MEQHTIADLVANLLGVFDIDWEKDFEDDGYRDVLSFAPFKEPIWQKGTHKTPITMTPLSMEVAENG